MVAQTTLTFAQWVAKVWDSGIRAVAESFQEVATAPFSKGAVALGLTTVYEICGKHFLGEFAVLYIWLVFIATDFFVGVARAMALGTLSRAGAVRGVRKFFIHFSSIAAINLLCYSFQLTTGSEVPLVVNLYIFFLTLTEAVSIVVNLEKAGWEPPPLLVFILHKWRYKIIKNISCQVGDGNIDDFHKYDPDFVEAISRSKGCRRTGRSRDTGERRRRNDDVAGSEGRGSCGDDQWVGGDGPTIIEQEQYDIELDGEAD